MNNEKQHAKWLEYPTTIFAPVTWYGENLSRSVKTHSREKWIKIGITREIYLLVDDESITREYISFSRK